MFGEVIMNIQELKNLKDNHVIIDNINDVMGIGNVLSIKRLVTTPRGNYHERVDILKINDNQYRITKVSRKKRSLRNRMTCVLRELHQTNRLVNAMEHGVVSRNLNQNNISRLSILHNYRALSRHRELYLNGQ